AQLRALDDTPEARYKQAEIFAELANTEKISDFRPWQIEKLLEDARGCYLTLNKNNFAGVHHWTHYLINNRLDHGRVDVSQFEKNLARPTFLEGNEKLTAIRYDFDVKNPHNIKNVLGVLWDVITLHPFPFRRCPVCKKVFVLAGKKKYCNSRCTNLALGPRTKYMREYMRKKRAREKKRKARGE
ncbi:MAG TPA: hypothetical protein VNN13_09060, partial [Methylomirabilota bacterium]|nr:hypothetical protein [Methylomirabilota bacterium]